MLSPQQREEQIFAEALKHSAAERAIFLNGACHGDPALRARLDVLLAAHEQQASSAGVGPGGTVKIQDGDIRDEAVGQTIGRYKLLERLGEGGCGVVYVAEQTEPVRRRVALKVIKLGMDTKAVVARFEAERQALAMMDHPNIAKVLDAGTTETGRPFFVMELVRGIRITDYCDQSHLSTTDRINLFIKVCQAIQHAHQKGIIHRDIKPSNILVTLHDGVPVPKVIDFGIAKATEGRLTDHTVYTQLHQFIGTPVYMSPEQAEMSGLDVDTRSDIYSLGVLLYELLAGSTPFDPEELMAQGLDAMRRTIREKEPARPSTRLATLQLDELTTTAKRRSSDTHKLVHQLKGDLDWIVMKCLEKDRTRRYETATGLALNLKRHLENEPVSARPPSIVYKFQKSFRRNKLAFTAAAAVIVALILGVIGTTIGLVRAEQHHRLAQKNFDQARAAVSDLLAIADEDLYDVPGMQLVRMKLMQSTLERYKPFLEQSSSDPGPRADLARLYAKIGFTAHDFGDEKTATSQYHEAMDIQRQLIREHPGDRALRLDYGWTLLFAGWPDDNLRTNGMAAKVFQQLMDEDPTDPFARADLAWALWECSWSEKGDERKAHSETALELREQLVKEFPESGEFRRDLANSISQKAIDTKNPSDQLALYSRAIDIYERLVSDLEKNLPVLRIPSRPHGAEASVLRPSILWMHRDQARAYHRIARVYINLHQWTNALSYLDRSKAIYRNLVEQNPSMSDFANELVAVLNHCSYVTQQLGNLDAAEAYSIESINLTRRLLPEMAEKLAPQLNELAWIYATSNDPKQRNGPKAVELAEEAVRLTKRQNPDWLDTLSASYAENQQFDKAVATQKEAISLLKTDSDIRRDMTNFVMKLNLYQSNKPYREDP